MLRAVFLILFLLRVLLRKEWIALVVLVAVLTLVVKGASTTPAVDYPIAAVVFAIWGVGYCVWDY